MFELEALIATVLICPNADMGLLSVAAILGVAGLIGCNAVVMTRLDRRRKQADLGLKQSNQALEQQVAERTLQLRQAIDQLQHEVQQRQQRENALQRSEARYRALITASAQAVWTTNAAGEVVEDNPVWRAMTGQSEAEIKGWGWIDAIHPDDRAHTAQVWTDAVARKNLYEIEHRVRTADKGYRLFYVRGVPLLDETGTIDEWIGADTDITERKRAEQVLKQTNEALEHHITERTIALSDANQQLQRELGERKRVEQALRQSEERYRAIVEDQTDLICRFLPDTTILFINEAYCRYFGLNRDEMIGRSYNPVIYPDDIEQVMQRVNSISPDHPVVTIENRVVIAGEVRWTQWINRAFFNEQGQVIEYQSVGRDITDLKCIETALRISEERWNFALEGSGDGVWDWDAQTNKVFFSRRWKEMLGFAEDEIGHDLSEWDKRVHPDDKAAVYVEIEKHFRGEVPQYTSEHRVQCKDGTYQWILDRGRVMSRTEAGQPLRVIGTHTDITDRKQAQAILQESDRRWRSLLDNVQLLVVELDKNGNVEYVNPFFLQLAGYSQAEVLGKNWFANFLPSEHQSQAQVCFREVLEHNFHSHYQNPIRTRSGEERLIAWNNTLLKDLQGNAIGTTSIGEDITERFRLDQMKAEFISIVSHELRTPLTSMQGALSLLNDGLVDPKTDRGQRIIKIAANGVDRLVRLVNDILDLDRLESGKINLEKHTCDTADLVTRAAEQMQAMANQAEIYLHISPQAFWVNVDVDRILQVLINLLSNAIKFSSGGTIVQLSVEQVREGKIGKWGGREQGNQKAEKPKNHSHPSTHLPIHSSTHLPYVRFAVKDQGRGIPADKLESIFERFHQVDASDSRQKGGTGLGLTICRSIVEQHGGEIWVESTPGVGSGFYFILPKSEVPKSEVPKSEHDISIR